MNVLHSLEKLLGAHHAQKQQVPQQSGTLNMPQTPAGTQLQSMPGLQMLSQPPQPQRNMSLGNVMGADGYYPQDNYQADELTADNRLQPSYQNPQASLYGPMQQGAMPRYGTYGQAADPLGWSQQGQAGVIRRFR